VHCIDGWIDWWKDERERYTLGIIRQPSGWYAQISCKWLINLQGRACPAVLIRTVVSLRMGDPLSYYPLGELNKQKIIARGAFQRRLEYHLFGGWWGIPIQARILEEYCKITVKYIYVNSVQNHSSKISFGQELMHLGEFTGFRRGFRRFTRAYATAFRFCRATWIHHFGLIISSSYFPILSSLYHYYCIGIKIAIYSRSRW